jgi:hypothetical protein
MAPVEQRVRGLLELDVGYWKFDIGDRKPESGDRM